jgi:ADP-ribose pyrophosphatase YjhB (NUDIX family)
MLIYLQKQKHERSFCVINSKKPAGFVAQSEVVHGLIDCGGERVIFQQHIKGSIVYEVPNGKLRSGETPDQACSRTIFETVGHKIEIDSSVQKKTAYVQFPGQDFVCHIYNVCAPKKFSLKVNPEMHKNGFWVKHWKVMNMPLTPESRLVLEFYFNLNPTKFCAGCKTNPAIKGSHLCIDCVHSVKKKLSNREYVSGADPSAIREQRDRKIIGLHDRYRGQTPEEKEDE